jgi:threonine dehydrogenase-like Zn-dependent dehydrogenase
MRGLYFAGNRTIGRVEVPDPTPGPGEVVLQMRASGICGSDLHLYRGAGGAASMGLAGVTSTEPIIGGHEPCGVVAEVGAGVGENLARIGDRVMVHHYWGCAACDQCRRGWSQMCERQAPVIYGVSGHGGHAPYIKVPAQTLVALPDELSFEAGAAIACGTGTAFGALRRMGVMGDETVAVFGQGPVGLAGTQFASAMGARVIALDIDADRLERAKSFGADAVINPAKDDPIQAIRELTGGRGAHQALEASGSPDARIAAIRSVRPWGQVCFVGVGRDVTIDVGPDLLQRQVTVFGSWTFSNVGQGECARYAAERGIAVDAVFTDRWTLDQAEEAYQVVDRQSGGKGVFLIG